MAPLFDRVLVANRGEIAIRVFRTCRELGIGTVAVYSDADRAAPHVSLADRAVRIGPAPARESYLLIDRVVEAARKAGADAVHPGYGFLAENPDFAEAVEAAGLTWIGPLPRAMRLLGDKTSARALAVEQGVPVVPGTGGVVASDEEAAEASAGIGYPVLLKAAAGGGGKGMRVVERPEDLSAALRTARSEALSAFGDDAVFVQKYLPRPRHVEFQLMADRHGGCVWLGERECSVQRRHQKIVEETPSPAVDEDLRRRMGEAAVRLAGAAGYTSAGTAEFLLDSDAFYFLEVNARLQVEHPVTEMVTGRDLVHDQLRVAAGEPLGYAQEDIVPRGAAIELRVYAEDPDESFFPSPGLITHLDPPGGPGIRHDCGVAPGSEVTLHYDSLIAKLVAWAPDRDTAIERALRALSEYRISGVVTILPFLRRVLEHPSFRSGDYDTHLLEGMNAGSADGDAGAGGVGEGDAPVPELLGAVAAALLHVTRPRGFRLGTGEGGGRPGSRWVREGREVRSWPE